METLLLFWVLVLGFRGWRKKKMETTIVFWVLGSGFRV